MLSSLGTGSTVVSVQNGGFAINGRPTYAGRSWKGHRIEGLLGRPGRADFPHPVLHGQGSLTPV